jgi:alkanesulfonate monooxygenase SsuD/methylene tetrahydromethanopterin reductase-like flavin-dependent oxidoreductase (luciferase family)
LAGWVTSMREAVAPHGRALTVAAGPMTAVDEDVAAARSIAASCAAWYLTAMGDVYARSVSGQGYGAEVRAIIAANPRPSPRRAAVPAEAQVILDQLAAYGTRDQVREQLELWDRAADIVMIGLPPGIPWGNIEATLLAAAPTPAADPAASLIRR